MFTGIIETTGKITKVEKHGSNVTFWIDSAISSELSIDQSVAHSGVCLTVEAIAGSTHQVTAIEETLKKTNLRIWEVNTVINLERCLKMNGRLDGHIVQGHVDGTGTCTDIQTVQGSWEMTFMLEKNNAPLIIEKGSISLNGISLTIFNVKQNSFTVAIIPYTYAHTNIGQLSIGSSVNLEFDIIGKYVQRWAAIGNPQSL